MTKRLTETTNVWFAALLVYLYGIESLATIRDEQGEYRKILTTYGLACPEEDVKILNEEYSRESDNLVIKPRPFVAAFNAITRIQNDMRRRRDVEWTSPDWISGKVG
jgi:hypothetical protein